MRREGVLVNEGRECVELRLENGGAMVIPFVVRKKEEELFKVCFLNIQLCWAVHHLHMLPQVFCILLTTNQGCILLF